MRKQLITVVDIITGMDILQIFSFAWNAIVGAVYGNYLAS